MFLNDAPGTLVTIRDSDPVRGPWEHKAFVPEPLGDEMPSLTSSTYMAVADARAALAALDNTARQLPNPTLLRLPTLRREAQSTSALEGTYAPLTDVLTADEDAPPNAELNEIFNYVRMANHGFGWVTEGRPLSIPFLSDLQGLLMERTPLADVSGRVRDTQVVIGRRSSADLAEVPARAARFVPSPPGPDLSIAVRDLADWIQVGHRKSIDPVVTAAMAHYQFETLHPFHDGNGRVGRLLIVLCLQISGVLTEPTLTVSPWFEARREQYYDRLLGVSTSNNWDDFIQFFAIGLQAAADATRRAMVDLVAVQRQLKEIVRASSLRADSAHALVDLAVAHPTLTVRRVETALGLSYGRANKLVGQLTELGILRVLDPGAYKRRYVAPRVLDVLTQGVL